MEELLLYNSHNLKGRDFLSLQDFTPEEIMDFVRWGQYLKYRLKHGLAHKMLVDKSIGMIFQKSSTRTRLAFEVGMYQLGGQALFLSPRDIQIGRGETLKDTARVLSRMLDGILIRTFAHDDVRELAECADIPVINGLTDLLHPTQIIADFMTILEHKGRLAGIKCVFIGDGNNVAHSLLLGGSKIGMDITIVTPSGYEPDQQIVAVARANALSSGARIQVEHDMEAAVEGADVLYTDVWASMGEEAQAQEKEKAFSDYQINQKLLQKAKPGAIVMHCLPAKRGKEITDEVIEGPQSVIFDEAENRLHAHKAIMALLL